MEDNAIRAITIGVGVLIAIATISLVLNYYNTAKESLSSLGKGTDLNQNYNKYITDILAKPKARGTDVINILNYFENNLNIVKILNSNGFEISDKLGFRKNILPNEKFLINVANDYQEITITQID